MSENQDNPSAGDQDSELRAVRGLGPKSAPRLRAADIETLQDLARFRTPEELHFQLVKRGVGDISLVQIENTRYPDDGDWVSQARRLLASTAASEAADDSVETGEVGDEMPESSAPAEASAPAASTIRDQPPTDRCPLEQPSFMVDFGKGSGDEPESSGLRTWVTDNNKADDDPDAVRDWDGVSPSDWATWILEQSELPVPDGLLRSKEEPEPARTEAETRLNITGFKVTKLNSRGERVDDRFKVLVGLKLSGPGAAEEATGQLAFRTEVLAVNEDGNILESLASSNGRFDPGRFTYTQELTFGVPEIGIYRLWAVGWCPRAGCRFEPVEGQRLTVVEWAPQSLQESRGGSSGELRNG
ncbi:MAG: hypothetical protein GY926_21315 [bacterium]|nr:hypothetical protein [bacterium]